MRVVCAWGQFLRVYREFLAGISPPPTGGASSAEELVPLHEVRGLHAESAGVGQIRRDELHSMATAQRQYSAVDEQQLNDAARVEVVD